MFPKVEHSCLPPISPNIGGQIREERGLLIRAPEVIKIKQLPATQAARLDFLDFRNLRVLVAQIS
jgi:hypothetical protein